MAQAERGLAADLSVGLTLQAARGRWGKQLVEVETDGVHALEIALLDSSNRLQPHALPHLEVRAYLPSRDRRRPLGRCTGVSGPGGSVFANLGDWARASGVRCDLPRVQAQLAVLAIARGPRGQHVSQAGRMSSAARSAVRSSCRLADGVPRGIDVRTNEPRGGPEGRRVHDRPTPVPRATRSSSSCSNVSLIISAAPVPAASRASFEG
jgi:hypothetical protein